jgi:hypothetical protein
MGRLLRRGSHSKRLCLLPPAPQRFLEDVIKRLSAELARHLSGEAGGAPAAPGAPRGGAAGAGAGDTLSGAPLPPWMSDPGFLNPLLAAYDARLAAAEGELAERVSAVGAVQEQVRGLGVPGWGRMECKGLGGRGAHAARAAPAFDPPCI